MSVWMYSTRWPRWIGPFAYGKALVTSRRSMVRVAARPTSLAAPPDHDHHFRDAAAVTRHARPAAVFDTLRFSRTGPLAHARGTEGSRVPLAVFDPSVPRPSGSGSRGPDHSLTLAVLKAVAFR